jgi:putative sigma-54 modulation protein
MEIHITGHNIEVTPALKQYVEKKMQRVQHHDNHITKIAVTLSVEKVEHVAEGTVHLSGTDFHGKVAEKKDMYAAIDLLVDKLLAQITKHKEKSTDHR